MRRSLRVVLALVVAAAFAAPASAAPVITIDSIVLPGGGPGTLNISISVPTGDPAIQLGGFSLDVGTSGGLQFTGVTYPATNYVYDGNSYNVVFGLPFTTDTFPNAAFNATDAEDGTFGFTLINPGQSFKLATVAFNAPLFTGTPGDSYPITLAGTTLLVDLNGDPIPFTVAPGAVTVIPEPATLAVFGAVALAGVAARRRRPAAA